MVIKAGVLGYPIGQSLSPFIHGRWFENAGLNGTYEAIAVLPEEFAARVQELAAAGWRGVNVTIPHKAAALAIADNVSDAARAIGAANLVLFEDGKITADNTDWIGFERGLADLGIPRPGKKAVVLGAGGAAAGILYALREWDEVIVLNRTRERAEALARNFANAEAGSWDDRMELLTEGPDLLVNTTSLGMRGQPPLEIRFEGQLPAAVVDIITSKTPLLDEARRAGVERVQNGLPMLVYQAVPSFLAFTGHDPDPAAVLEELQKRVL